MDGGRADQEVMEIRNVCIECEFEARVQTRTDVRVNRFCLVLCEVRVLNV